MVDQVQWVQIFLLLNQMVKRTIVSHPEPYRHEPVTQQNFGRTILRGIRCKIYIFLFILYIIYIKYLALWATRQTEKDLRKNKDLYVKTTIRELIIYLVFITILCISKYRYIYLKTFNSFK